MFLIISFYFYFILRQFYFFNDGTHFGDDEITTRTLGDVFKFYALFGIPQSSVADYNEMSLDYDRIVIDLSFFVSMMLILNILKGKTYCFFFILYHLNCITSHLLNN